MHPKTNRLRNTIHRLNNRGRYRDLEEEISSIIKPSKNQESDPIKPRKQLLQLGELLAIIQQFSNRYKSYIKETYYPKAFREADEKTRTNDGEKVNDSR